MIVTVAGENLVGFFFVFLGSDFSSCLVRNLSKIKRHVQSTHHEFKLTKPSFVGISRISDFPNLCRSRNWRILSSCASSSTWSIPRVILVLTWNVCCFFPFGLCRVALILLVPILSTVHLQRTWSQEQHLMRALRKKLVLTVRLYIFQLTTKTSCIIM